MAGCRSVCDHNLRRQAETGRRQSTIQNLLASSIGLMIYPTECIDLAELDGSDDESATSSTRTPRFRFAVLLAYRFAVLGCFGWRMDGHDNR